MFRCFSKVNFPTSSGMVTKWFSERSNVRRTFGNSRSCGGNSWETKVVKIITIWWFRKIFCDNFPLQLTLSLFCEIFNTPVRWAVSKCCFTAEFPIVDTEKGEMLKYCKRISSIFVDECFIYESRRSRVKGQGVKIDSNPWKSIKLRLG